MEDYVFGVTDGDHQPPPQANEGVPFLVISDVNTGKICFDKSRFVEESYFSSLPDNRKASKGDLLFTVTGSYGIVIPVETEREFCFQRHIGLIKVIADSSWLKYVLMSKYVQAYCDKVATGTAQKTVGLAMLRELLIPIPPLSEQQRIISVIERCLLLVDDVRTSTIELKDRIVKAKNRILDLAIRGKLVPQDPNDELASELLKRINPKAIASCDNPHYENVPFVLPSNWVWVKLGDITNYGKCSTCSVDDIGNDSWILELEDIEKNTGRVLVKHTKAERDIKGVRHSFFEGNVLYSKLRTYLNKVLLANEDGFCTTEIIPIECTDAVYSQYLCYVLRSQYFLDYTIQCGYGVKMPRLSTNDARKAMIPLPPLPEQLKIIEKVESITQGVDCIARALQ